MFCKNCGTENLDTAKFCVGCGNDLTAAPAEPVYEAPVYEAPVYEAPVEAPVVEEAAPNAFNQAIDFGKNYMEEAKKDKKKLLPLIIAGAGVLTLILILLLTAKPYKSALNRELKYYNGKATERTIQKSYPKDYWEYMEDEYDMTAEDRFESYEDYVDDMIEELEEEYGRNVRISYKVKNKDKLSDKKLNNLKDYYKGYDMAKKKLTKAYELELEITIKGSDDKEVLDAEAIVYKYAGKWYVYSLDIDY